MPRRPRTEAPGAIYHVIARGNGGARIVVDDKDRVAFIDRVACVCGEFEWRLHAYCLMDTHVHAVIETPKPTLGVGMQKLVGGHAYMFNRRHQRSGISSPGLTTPPSLRAKPTWSRLASTLS